MSRVNTTQQNFTSGELSPKMRGRHDLAMYHSGAERMENFVPELQGPAKYRNGTKYITNCVHTEPKFIPFIFDEDDAYLLEFSEFFIRVFRNEAPVNFVSGADIEGLESTGAGGSFKVHLTGTQSVTAWAGQNSVSFYGITEPGYEYLNNQSFTCTVGTSAWNAAYAVLTISSNYAPATQAAFAVSAGSADSHVCIPTAFNQSDLDSMAFTQAYDTMYLSDGAEKNYKLVRTSHTSWALTFFVTTGTTFATASNYPSASAFYENRLWFANTGTNPNVLWGSLPEVYSDFTLGATAADAVSWELASSRNDILHLVGYQNFLMALTLGGAFKVDGGNAYSPIDPVTISVKPIHYVGSSSVRPVFKDSDLIFLEKGGLKVRMVEYSFERDQYEPRDLTILAEHITLGGIRQLAYQQGKNDIVWAVKNVFDETSLVGLLYSRGENIMAWFRHVPGGLQATIKTAATLPAGAADDTTYLGTFRNGYYHQPYTVDSMVKDTVYPAIGDYYTGDEALDEKLYLGDLYYYQQRAIHLDRCMTYDSTDGGTQGLTLSALTGSSATVTAGGAMFAASDVGRRIVGATLSSAASAAYTPYGIAEIIGYTSSTSVTVKIIEDFESLSLVAGYYSLTVTTISGLGTFEGQTVQVIADGSVHPDVLVTDSTITLDYQASYVQIGHGYTGIIKSTSLEVGGSSGPANTKLKNIHKVGVKFDNSLGVKFGSDIYNTEEIDFRDTQGLLDRPTELFTGEKIVTFKESWERDKHVYIVQDKALPCTVQMLVPYLTTNEE